MLWGFFPSITAYHYERVESTGALYLIGGLMVSVLLMLSVYFKGDVRVGLRGFAIILVPFLCFLIFSTLFHYGVNSEPIAPTGISISSAIILSAFIGCLLANASSFGLGLVLL
jgi:drug/metabolite transporter (DMT)-like permease